MPAPATYATASDLESWYGQQRLASLFSHLDNSQLAPIYDLKLSAASAEMNAAFARASYSVPIDASQVQDPVLSSQLTHRLMTVCCQIALGITLGGVIDLPDSAKNALKEGRDWLCRVRDGAEALLGVDKVRTESDLLAAGRIGITTNPNDPAALDVQFFSDWRNPAWPGV